MSQTLIPLSAPRLSHICLRLPCLLELTYSLNPEDSPPSWWHGRYVHFQLSFFSPQESFQGSKIDCFPLIFCMILGFSPFHISWKALGLMSHVVSRGGLCFYSLLSTHRNYCLQLPQIHQSPDFHFKDININWAHMCQAMRIVWWGRETCGKDSVCLMPRDQGEGERGMRWRNWCWSSVVKKMEPGAWQGMAEGRGWWRKGREHSRQRGENIGLVLFMKPHLSRSMLLLNYLGYFS